MLSCGSTYYWIHSLNQPLLASCVEANTSQFMEGLLLQNGVIGLEAPKSTADLPWARATWTLRYVAMSLMSTQPNWYVAFLAMHLAYPRLLVHHLGLLRIKEI